MAVVEPGRPRLFLVLSVNRAGGACGRRVVVFWDARRFFYAFMVRSFPSPSRFCDLLLIVGLQLFLDRLDEVAVS